MPDATSLTHTDSGARTRLMCRILGPFLLVVALTIFTRYETMPVLLPAFMRDAPLLFVTGVFTLLTGLAILAFHPHWNTWPAIAVSVIGIVIVLRGAALMIAPEVVIGMAEHVVRWPISMLVLTTIALACGGWLTFVGWFAKSV